jgi:hypothetical protein
MESNIDHLPASETSILRTVLIQRTLQKIAAAGANLRQSYTKLIQILPP